MIPHRLTLRNFLCYGDAPQTLDFDAFHLACLSGRNGHGKSALLDALTWALFRQARKRSNDTKPDAGLLRRGAERMEVVLDFGLREQEFRLTRRYDAKGHHTVELVRLGADGELPLGRNAADTDARLAELLHLDYNTFINTSLILQGHADQFTQLKSNERKEVLQRLLELDRYERLGERATESLRGLESERETLRGRIEGLQSESGDPGDLRRQLDDAERDAALRTQAELDHQVKLELARTLVRESESAQSRVAEHLRREESLSRRLEDADLALEQLARKIAALDELESRANELKAASERDALLVGESERVRADLTRRDKFQARQRDAEKVRERRRRELEGKLAALRNGIAGDRATLEEWRTRLAEKGKLAGELEGLRPLTAALERTEALRLRAEALNAEIARTEGDLTLRRKAHAESLAALKNELAGLDRDLASGRDVESRIRQYDQELAGLDDLRKELEVTREQGGALRGERDALAATLLGIEAAITREETRQAGIEGTDQPRCPLCGSALTPEHRAEVMAELAGDLRRLREDLADRRKRITDLDRRLEKVRGDYARLNKEIAQKEKLRAEREELGCRMAELLQLLSRREETEARRAALTGIDPAGELPEVIAKLRAELNGLGYDPAAHEVLRRDCARIPLLEKNLADLQTLSIRATDLQSALASRVAELTTREEDLASGRPFSEQDEELSTLARELTALGDPSGRLTELESERKALLPRLKEWTALLDGRRERPEWLSEQSRWQERRQEAVTESDRSREARKVDEAKAAELPAIRRTLTEVEAQAATLRGEVLAATTRRAELALRLERVETARRQIAELHKEIQRLDGEVTVREILRKAFGRDGIPKLVLKQVLPDLEEAANDFLARVCEFPTEVRFITERETKSGALLDRLEIEVSDEAGVRPLELFSGGEAFRINLAIRLALSRILAERAGVQVRLLVVDEGFGTQDAASLEKLVGALHAVAADFDRILIVTHLEELKDAFGTTITVRRTDAGSVIGIGN